MSGGLYRSPVALFVSLTRAIRDASLDPMVRDRAFDAVDRMARSLNDASDAESARALADLAREHEALACALEPFWAPLEALRGKTPQ